MTLQAVCYIKKLRVNEREKMKQIRITILRMSKGQLRWSFQITFFCCCIYPLEIRKNSSIERIHQNQSSSYTVYAPIAKMNTFNDNDDRVNGLELDENKKTTQFAVFFFN